MSLALQDPIPSPHLLPSRSATWPKPYTTYALPLGSSPASASPQPAPPFIPHMSESPVSSQDVSDLPTPAWYGPPASGPNSYHISSNVRETTHDVLARTSYAPFHQFVPPHTSSFVLSQPTSAFYQSGDAPQHDPSGAISPTSVYSRNSVNCDSARASEEPQSYSRPKIKAHFEHQDHGLGQPNNRVNMTQAVPVSWAMDSLEVNSPAMHCDPFQMAYPPFFQNTLLGNPTGKVPSNHLASPQPRRVFTPIVPQLAETTHQLRPKRQRDEDEAVQVQESKRRRRSDSNTSAPPELSDEDKLLLKLKDEDSIPWKDIAARFQVELGKTYQIPALQMRLKRLRERLRVWNEIDIKALHMAHEFWIQSKFDIISQKVSRRRCTVHRTPTHQYRCSILVPKKGGPHGNVHENGQRSNHYRDRLFISKTDSSMASPRPRRAQTNPRTNSRPTNTSNDCMMHTTAMSHATHNLSNLLQYRLHVGSSCHRACSSAVLPRSCILTIRFIPYDHHMSIFRLDSPSLMGFLGMLPLFDARYLSCMYILSWIQCALGFTSLDLC
jgi:hypothetical protein